MSVANVADVITEDSAVVVRDADNDGASVRTAIANLASGKTAIYTSIKGNDFATKVSVVDALSNSVPIADHLDKVIHVKDIVVQYVDFLDKLTGEMVEAARVVLVAADGTAYHAMSKGLFRSVENIVSILGDPAGWPAPLPIRVLQMKASIGYYFTARIVRDNKNK